MDYVSGHSDSITAPGLTATEPSSPSSVGSTFDDAPSPYCLSYITTPLPEPFPEVQDAVKFFPELELGLSAEDESDVQRYILTDADAEGDTDDEIFPKSDIKEEETEDEESNLRQLPTTHFFPRAGHQRR
jgi:hypothetical protein